jgi:PKD repeat protein
MVRDTYKKVSKLRDILILLYLLTAVLSYQNWYVGISTTTSTNLCSAGTLSPTCSDVIKATYNVYYGNLHSHTDYSDGTGTPAEAYAYARDIANLDFLAVTDHGEYLTNSEWNDIVTQAEAYTEDGVFVAIHGFEWSHPKGHACVWNSTERTSAIGTNTIAKFYEWLKLRPEALAGFNHPAEPENSFNGLAYNDELTDARICGIEVMNYHAGTYEQHFPYYIRALDNGWRIGPCANQDNHEEDWGTKNEIRTAVLAPALTKHHILTALKEQRMYSTSDKNLELYFYGNGAPMGSTIGSGNINFELILYDPDDGEEFTAAKLYTDGGVVIETLPLLSNNCTTEFTVYNVVGVHYYFIEVYQQDGDIAVSAPFWTSDLLRPPIADAGEDIEVNTNEPVYFDGSGSYDYADGEIVSYHWDFGDGYYGYGVTVTHSYADDGIYIVTLTVTDDSGLSDQDSLNVTVRNVPPTASFFYTPTEPHTNEEIMFIATDSYDPDGTIINYKWDFGDGSEHAWGETVSHVYYEDGTYMVTLFVTDDDHADAFLIEYVTVTNAPPVAWAGEDLVVDVESIVVFDGSASYDPDGNIKSYSWDFDASDGIGIDATGSQVSHVYIKEGTYKVTLTVTDNDGISSSDTLIVTVENVVPTAVAGEDQTVYEDDVVMFNANRSFDTALDMETLVYHWNFDDGTTAEGMAQSHVYTHRGKYTVILTVTDELGASDTDTLQVFVHNVVPIANAGEDKIAVVGKSIWFEASAIDTQSDLETLQYFWKFGDGTRGEGKKVCHSYARPNLYQVELTVIDDDGAQAIDVINVTVKRGEHETYGADEVSTADDSTTIIDYNDTARSGKPADDVDIRTQLLTNVVYVISAIIACALAIVIVTILIFRRSRRRG